MEQRTERGQASLPKILRGVRRVFLVCGGSFDRLPLKETVMSQPAEFIRFSGFSPNPRYEDVRAGEALFRQANCDAILAIGGGSAIDTAKCVKLFSGARVPLIAAPTTAGTGSESTRHAVIYKDGVKQSISDPGIVPDYAVLIPEVLEQLPLYQKKCAMLDALCQGIESWWSIRATGESAAFSKAAVEGVAANWRAYIEKNDKTAAAQIMEAANASGRAINITATTAPHAMSYRLTSLYGIPHGHAVALCMSEVWPYLLTHGDRCADPRGTAHLERTLAEIGAVLAPEDFRGMLSALGMERPRAKDREAELALLAASVNPERLQNNPVTLSHAVLRDMYERIVR